MRSPIRKLGPFTPDLHPHGFHGYWSATGGANLARGVVNRLRGASQALNRIQEVGSTGNRVRTRTGSARAYHQGPGRGPGAQAVPAHIKPILTANQPLSPRVRVHLHLGQGAGKRVVVGRVATHHVSQGVHHVTVHTPQGLKTFHLRPSHPSEQKMSAHPSRTRSQYPRPSAYVDHQAIEQFLAGRARRQLPRAQVQPSKSTIQRPVKKDAMTVTEDLGHDGQSPVTIMQGGSRLERCPVCGYKLSSDGQCPRHGNVLKARLVLRTGGATLLRKEDGPVPSTGEALPGNTIMDPSGRAKKLKPPFTEPVPTSCQYCGGTDGFHQVDCPKYICNPGGGPAGYGSS